MDDTDIDPEIAAAMGFSSFGGPKRRKFNHDAVIDGVNVNQPHKSGANTAPLGTRTAFSNAESNQLPLEHPSHSNVPGVQDPNARNQAALSHFSPQGFDLPKRPPKPEGQTNRTEKQSESANIDASPKTTAFPTGVPKQFFDKLTWKELEAFRKGVKDGNGDVAFFLPSFIEDPWAKLEREREVEGSGS
jgi:hypothetical protein